MYLLGMEHTQIIKLWPSLSDFAADLGVEYGTAKAMKRRGSIPSRRWTEVVNAAHARGYRSVTLEALAEATKRRAA